MNKAVSLLLVSLMSFGLAACSNSAGQEAETSPGTTQAQTSLPVESASTEATQPDRAESSGGSADSAAPVTQPTGAQDNHILVAYFSATGTTKGVAETLAEGLDADLYEITPVEPYTDADLDYNDDNSRTTIEMNDPSARPEISGSVEDMEQYDIIFLGYPIWWGQAPRIMSTFVESYDFSGKTVIPFCTSGSSGIGSSGRNLEALTSGATWLEGTRFSGGASEDAIMEWANSLGLMLTGYAG